MLQQLFKMKKIITIKWSVYSGYFRYPAVHSTSWNH